MTTSTTRPTAAEEQDQHPVDIETMRATARRLLTEDAAPDALPPAADELDTLTATLRGHLQLLAPDVERTAERRPKDVAQYCALACVGEARMKLRITPRVGLAAGAAHARRLARVLNALCDHYENLIGGPR